MPTEQEDYKSTFALIVNGKVVHIAGVHNVLADIYKQNPIIVDITQQMGTVDEIKMGYEYENGSFSIPQDWIEPPMTEVPETIFVKDSEGPLSSPEPLADNYTEQRPN